MFKEFKTFIMRGNVMDLAIGVIIGAAFSNIVSSLITDVITPLILSPAMEAAGVNDLATWGIGSGHNIKIGKFFASVITFLLTAFILFLIIKGFNRLTKKEKEEKAIEDQKIAIPSKEQELLAEIRDLLKK
ncbi:MAG: large conductance mechanosensitive channel protein MscL [Flavobacteriia bacterium]|nr:large conductance mechanosensitive channel protein MscL [Flavobacteriia bacterium]